MASLSENSNDKSCAELPRIKCDLTGSTKIILGQSQATRSVADESPEQLTTNLSKLSDINSASDHIHEASEQQASDIDKYSDSNSALDEGQQQQTSEPIDEALKHQASELIDEALKHQASLVVKLSDECIDGAQEQQTLGKTLEHQASDCIGKTLEQASVHTDEALEQQTSEHIDKTLEQQSSAVDKLCDKHSSSDPIDKAPEQQSSDHIDEKLKQQALDDIDETPEQQAPDHIDEVPKQQSSDQIDEAPQQQASDQIDEAPQQQASDQIDEAPQQQASDHLTFQDIRATDSITSSAYSNMGVGSLKSESPALSKMTSQSTTLKLQTDILSTSEQNNQQLTADRKSVCNLEEQKYADVTLESKKTVESVVPESFEKTLSHHVPCDVTKKQLNSSEFVRSNTASHVSQTEQIHCKQIPNYILVHKKKSVSMQEASKKPGEKLTSLLERLIAVRGLTVAPKGSTCGDSGSLSKPVSSVATKTETSFTFSETSLASGSSTGPHHVEPAVPTATLKVYKRHTPFDGSANESDSKQAGIKTTITKSKKQFSLLKNISSQHHTSLQITTSASAITKTPTIYSLLANSTAKPTSMSESLKHPIFGAPGFNVPITNSSPFSFMIKQDSNSSSIRSLGQESIIIAPHCMPPNTGQVVFRPVLNAGSNTNIVLSGASTLTFSKSANTPAVCDTSMITSSIAPCTSSNTFTQSRTSSVSIMPSAGLATPVSAKLATTVSAKLATSARANSESNIPVGIITKSNMAVQPTFIQPSTNTQQSCSKLITKLAQQSFPSIYAFRQATQAESNILRSLNVSVQPDSTQDILQPAMITAPSLRFILSGAPNSNPAAKSAYSLTETDLSDKDDASTRSSNNTSHVLTVSKAIPIPVTSKPVYALATPKTALSVIPSKNAQVSLILKKTPNYVAPKTAHVSDNNGKHNPTLQCPKPVKVTASHPANIPVVKLLPQTLKLVVPHTSKGVSLLTMSPVPTIQNTSASGNKSAAAASGTKADKRRKLKSKAAESVQSQLLMQNDLGEGTVENAVQSPSLQKVHTDTSTKPNKNSFYTATLRTGQGPVSVMVVAPDVDDDSSDMMSDAGVTNLRFPEKPVLVCKSAKAMGSCMNESLSDKLSDVRCPDQLYLSNQYVQSTAAGSSDVLLKKVSETGLQCLKKTIYGQDIVDSSSCVDTLLDKVLDTEVQDLGYSREEEITTHSVRQRATSFDEEDTDSDFDTVNAEEQDMSVLRQLLMTAGSVRPPDDYNTTSRRFQVVKVLTPEMADDIISRKHFLEPRTGKKTDFISIFPCPGAEEDRLPNNSVSSQQPAFPSSSPIKQNDLNETTVKHSEGNEFSGLKIESVFSLSDSPDFENSYFKFDNTTDLQWPEFSKEHKQVFKVKESDEWKNFVCPCFVVLERLSKLEILAKDSGKTLSKCSGHCRKRTLDYLCNLNLLTCVNHPDTSLFSKPKKRRTGIKEILGNAAKHEAVSRETCVSEATTETSARCSPFERGQKQELSYKLHDKPLTSARFSSPILVNTVQSSVVNTSGLSEIEQSILPVQDNQNISNKLASSLSAYSDLENRGFLVDLQQLQKQVKRKRAKMLKLKVSRETKAEPLMKSKNKPQIEPLMKSKNKPQIEPLMKSKNKPQIEPLIKKMPVSTDIMKTTEFNNSSTTDHNVRENILSRFQDNSLPQSHSDKSYCNPAKKCLASADIPAIVNKSGVKRSGISSVSGMKNKSAFKVSISASSNLKTTTNLNIQPKPQNLPAEKIKAALQSLNSYLVATGRKPTDGNTQYILLKIDDQHVLVKLPTSSDSTVQENTPTLPNMTKVDVRTSDDQPFEGDVNKKKHQQMQSRANSDTAKSVSKVQENTANKFSNVKLVYVRSDSQPVQRDVNEQYHLEMQSGANSNNAKAVSNIKTTEIVSKKNITPTTAANMTSTFIIAKSAPDAAQLAFSFVRSVSGTTSLVPSIANTSKTILSSSNTTSKTLSSSIVTSKPLTCNIASDSKRISFRVTKTNINDANVNREKTSPSCAQHISINVEEPKYIPPHEDNHQNISDSSADDLSFTSSHTDHSYITNDLNEGPKLISQRPDGDLQSQDIISLANPGCRISNANSTITVSVGPNNELSSTISDCPVGGEANIVLSRLPPNSSLLPERRKRPSALSEEEKRCKLRKLESKYPLPPGVVIKSEPDDLGYEMSTDWSDVAQSLTDNFSVVSTVHTLSRESPISSSQHQVWSVANPDNSSSYLPLVADEGLHTEESNRSVSVLDLPAYPTSSLEETSSAESVDSEGSSSELDEPPALVDETTADDMHQIMQVGKFMDAQEDMPPILQPMFTSSYSSLVEDTDTIESENTCIFQEKSTHMSSYRNKHSARGSGKAIGCTSASSLHSECSLDSGIGTNTNSTSSSYTSVKESVVPAAEKLVCKNLKIQHLKELLKKKEMEIENMKKMQSEFPPLDLDLI